MEVPVDLVSLVVKGPGRQGRADGDDGRQHRCGNVGPGQPGIAAAPATELFDHRASPGLDWPVGQEALQVCGHLSRSLIAPIRLLGNRLEDQRFQVTGNSAIELRGIGGSLWSIRSTSCARSAYSKAGCNVTIS